MTVSEDRTSAVVPLTAGIAHFNEGRFWHAHESWEELWLVSSGERKQFLQGLIQLAAAYHHVERGNRRGASRLFEAALRRLESIAPRYLGVDRAEVEQTARQHRQMILAGDPIDLKRLPKLRYNERLFDPTSILTTSEG